MPPGVRRANVSSLPPDHVHGVPRSKERQACVRLAAEAAFLSRTRFQRRQVFLDTFAMILARDHGITVQPNTLRTAYPLVVGPFLDRIPRGDGTVTNRERHRERMAHRAALLRVTVEIIGRDHAYRTQDAFLNAVIEMARRESDFDIANPITLRRNYWEVLKPYCDHLPRREVQAVKRQREPSPEEAIAALKRMSRRSPFEAMHRLIPRVSTVLRRSQRHSVVETLTRLIEAERAINPQVEAIVYRHISRSTPVWRSMASLRKEIVTRITGLAPQHHLRGLTDFVKGGPAEYRFLIEVLKAGWRPTVRDRGFDETTGDYIVLYLLEHLQQDQRMHVIYVDDAVDFSTADGEMSTRAARRREFVRWLESRAADIGRPIRQAQRTKQMSCSGVRHVVFYDQGWRGRVSSPALEKRYRAEFVRVAVPPELRALIGTLHGEADRAASVTDAQARKFRDSVALLTSSLHLAERGARQMSEVDREARRLQADAMRIFRGAGGGGGSLRPAVARGPIARSIPFGMVPVVGGVPILAPSLSGPMSMMNGGFLSSIVFVRG